MNKFNFKFSAILNKVFEELIEIIYDLVSSRDNIENHKRQCIFMTNKMNLL